MPKEIRQFDLKFEEDLLGVFQISDKCLKGKLAIENDIDLTDKKIGFILEPGSYQAGKFYQFFETKGQLSHDKEKNGEFSISINPEEGCFKTYNGCVDQYQFLKLVYEKQGLKLEVTEDFLATQDGSIETMGVLFDSFEEI